MGAHLRRPATALAVVVFATTPAAAETVEACLASTFPTTQLRCLIAAAKEANDPRLCLAATNPGVRWMCVAQAAEAAGDAAQCGVLPEAEAVGPRGLSRELCRGHLAIAWREPETCATLVPAELADACHMQLGELEGDPAFCAPIVNETLRETCLAISQPQ